MTCTMRGSDPSCSAAYVIPTAISIEAAQRTHVQIGCHDRWIRVGPFVAACIFEEEEHTAPLIDFESI